MTKKIFSYALALTLAAASASAAVRTATPMGESLDRGVIAVKMPTGVFVSWRSFSADDSRMTFDVYRDGVRVNADPIVGGTNLKDTKGTASSKYTVKAFLNGEEVETTDPVAVEANVYKRVHLDRPKDGKTPKGDKYSYTPNDCSAADVDGDGQYEIIVKWDPSNSRDNSENGYTGNVFIDCYKLDGTKLWRIDLGRNIRAGAHYTQFMVYDLDGDGKAEMACKTAPGTIDGKGKAVLLDGDKEDADYRGTSGSHTTGTILTGSEYLTVFNGETGAEITTVPYEPARSIQKNWGDSYGNRSERYLACVAYLDGKKPSLVMCRGYYTYAYLCAWDFDGKKLTKRWMHESTKKGKEAYGEGAHSLTVGDLDGDGKDEIVYGSCAIDHDGKLLYRTGGGHGDALHLGDFDPDHEGLEIFMVHEEKGSGYPFDSSFRAAGTGEILWCTKQSGNDIGRGMAADLSDTWRGYEVWPSSYVENGVGNSVTFSCKGKILARKRASTCFRVYWDGDLLDELFDGRYDKDNKTANPQIEKRSADLTSGTVQMDFSTYKAQSCNTTKATPCLSADILGDWREEVVLWDGANSSDLMIFTTTIPSAYRVPTLMEDHNYRLAIAWQNVAYNQPPHLGFYISDRYSIAPIISAPEEQLNQTVELGQPIQPISGTFERCTSVVFTGMPKGVKGKADDKTGTFTISGTPTAEGEFTFAVRSKGGEGNTTLKGTITVTPASGVEGIADADDSLPGELTLIDAVTGIVVARGSGDPASLTTGQTPGIYILLTRRGSTRTASKIILK